MTILALVLYLAFLGLSFGVRSFLHWRRTGGTGFVGLSGRLGSVEWWGGVLFALGVLLGLAAPVVELASGTGRIGALDVPALEWLGLVLAVGGAVAVLAAQAAMGSSWRIGVDESERTALVTTGPFALVRNPIFAGMLPASVGMVLLVPTWLSLMAFFALWAAVEVQVRAVEEPYLRRVHAAAYERYAGRVGRFVPGVGRLRRPRTTAPADA